MDTLLTRDEIRQIVKDGMHVPGSRLAFIVPFGEAYEADNRDRYEAEVDRLTAIFNGLQANFVRNTESCADDGNTASQDARKGQFQAILRALMAHYDRLYLDGQESLVRAYLADRKEDDFGKYYDTQIKDFGRQIEQSVSVEFGYSEKHIGYYVEVLTPKERSSFLSTYLVNDGTGSGTGFANSDLIDSVIGGLNERGWLPSPSIGEFAMMMRKGSAGFEYVLSLLRDCLSVLPSTVERFSVDTPIKPYAERCGRMYAYILDSCGMVLPNNDNASKGEEASELLTNILDIEGILESRKNPKKKDGTTKLDTFRDYLRGVRD